jgi:hypothetical protein
VTQRFPRNPAFMVCDEEGMYSLGKPISNDEGVRYMWSEDNIHEVELGILKRSDSLSGLAHDLALMRWPCSAAWNMMCDRGADEDFGRPTGSMMRIERPPF